MSFPGGKLKSFPASRRARALLAGGTVAAGLLMLTAPVVGDGVNHSPEPASPMIAATVPATTQQMNRAGLSDKAVASTVATKSRKAGKARPRTRVVVKPVIIRSRITTEPVSTEENKGSFVGIRCPAGSRAISGGVLSKYINLMVSSSAPNHPVTGKYTPNTWWVSVTNLDVDGNGGTLAWKGVVNCLSPARIVK